MNGLHQKILWSVALSLLWLAVPRDVHAEKLLLLSLPRGASIYVDGVKRGRTPKAFQLSAGRYHVELRRKGYATWTSYVQVPSHAEMNLRIRLQKPSATNNTTTQLSPGGTQFGRPPARARPGQTVFGQKPPPVKRSGGKGLLVVQSEPTGVGVYLQGRLLGRTPLLSYLPIGTHQITLRQAGLVSIQRVVTITEAKSARLKLRMRQGSSGGSAGQSGGNTMLMILSTPAAKVRLNGRLMGTTPVLSAGLNPGVYRLRLTAPKYQVYRRVIRLHPGQHMRLKILLVPKSGR